MVTLLEYLELSCFNPYRVFKFVATAKFENVSQIKKTVSIPIGFSSSLQQESKFWNSQPGPGVSIPIGFSSSLQPPLPLSSPSQGLPGFNPYRVFKFVATVYIITIRYPHSIVSIPIGFSSSLQPRDW